MEQVHHGLRPELYKRCVLSGAKHRFSNTHRQRVNEYWICTQEVRISLSLTYCMGDMGWISHFLFCFSVIVYCCFMKGAWWYLCLFLCSCFALFVGILVRRCYCKETVLFALQYKFKIQVADHYSVNFLEKG